MRCLTRNVVGVLVMVVVVLCTAFSVSGQTTEGSICATGEFLRITEEGLVCDKAISELQRVLNEAVCKEGEYLRLSQQNNVYQLQCFSFSSAATVDESRLLPETACNVGQFVQFNAQGTAVCTSLTLTAGSQGPRGDRGDTGDAGDPGQHDHLNQYIGDHSDHAIQGGECPAGEIATGVSSTGQVTCTAQSQACSITVNTAKIDPRGYRINRPNSRTLNTGTFFTFTDCPTSGRSFTLGTPAAVPGRGGIAEFTSSPTSVSPSGTFTFSGTKNGVAKIPVTAKAGQASATATFQVTVGQFTQGCTIAKKGTVPTQNITVDETKTIDFSNYFTLTNCPATVVYEVIDIDAEGYLTATPTGKTKASSKTLTGKKKGSDEIAVVVDLDGTGAITASQAFTVNVSEDCTITSKLATDLILEVGKSRTINLATLFTTSAGCTSLEYTPPSSSFGFYSVTPSGKSSTSARTFKGLIKGDERGTFTVEDTVSGKTASVKKLIQVIQGCTITSTPFSNRSIQKGTTQNLNIAGGFIARNCSTLTYSATSSKPAIATVSGFGSGDATGTLSGVDFGATDITVTATSGTTSESRSFTLTVPACTITSTAIANQSVQVGKALPLDITGSFTAKDCGTLTYTVTPTKTATATASGYGSNDGAGSLTGVAAGSTAVEVTATSGGTTESRTFTLTVTAIPVVVCTITSTAISNKQFRNGTSISFNVEGFFTPKDCGTITYAVVPDDTSVVTAWLYGADDAIGALTGRKVGSTDVTVTASSGGTTESIELKVTITQQPVCTITSTAIANQSVQVGKALPLDITGSFTAKDCGTLTYTVTPTKTATATASGYGSNDGAGSLTGVAAGSTAVEVTATSGGTTESRTFTLTVTAIPVVVCTITSTAISNKQFRNGTSISFNVEGFFTPKDCGTITYAVVPDDTSVVTAWLYGADDAIGALTGRKVGSTDVTVTASSGGTTESIELKVTITQQPVCTITSTAIANQSVQVGKALPLDITGSFTAKDCGTLTYTVTPTKTATATASGYGSNDGAGSLTGVAAGSTAVEVTATSGGTTESRTFTLTVTAAPVCSITSTLPASFSVGVGETITINLSNYYSFSSGCPSTRSYFRIGGVGSLQVWYNLVSFNTSTGVVKIKGLKVTPTNGINLYLGARAGVGTLPTSKGAFTAIIVTGTPPARCPAGQVGTPPNCTTPPPARCPAGQVGTPPNCTTPPPARCPAGQVGTPPNCTTPPPARCPAGQIGTPPNCTTPPVTPRCRISGSVSNVTLTVGQAFPKYIQTGFRYTSSGTLRTGTGSFTFNTGCTSVFSTETLVCTSPSLFKIGRQYATIGTFVLTPTKAGTTNCTLKVVQQGTTHSDGFRVTVRGGIIVNPTGGGWCGTTKTKTCPGTKVKVGTCNICKITGTDRCTRYSIETCTGSDSKSCSSTTGSSCSPGKTCTTTSDGKGGSYTTCKTTTCNCTKRSSTAVCPSGWKPYLSYTTTTSKSCRGGEYNCSACRSGKNKCTTGGHSFSNRSQESCSYRSCWRAFLSRCKSSGRTCGAAITAIGCVPS